MSVQRNVIANFLSSGWTAFIGLAMLPVYLRYLGIESYGLIGFFVSLQTWLSLLDMGLTPTLNREMARFSAGLHTPQGIRNLLRSMEVIYAAVAIALALALAFGASWIATGWLNLQALAPRTATHALALMALVIGIQWLGTLYRSAVLGLQDQVWLSAVTAILASVRALGTVIVLALVSPTIVAFVVFQCVTSLAETLLLAWRVRRLLPRPPAPPGFDLQALREVRRFAAGITVITILATLLTQVDKLLLAKLLPLDQFGYFSLAVAVAGALSVLIGPINNAAYPRLSELAGTGSEQALAQEYHRFAQLLSVAMLPATLFLSVFSYRIVLLWTGSADTAQQVAPIVSVWAIGTALNGLNHVPYAAQLAHGWSRLTIVVNTVTLALMVPATLWLVPRHGAIAAAWIWVAINMGYIVFSIGIMHLRILKAEKWRWYLQDVLAPLVPSLLVVLAMWALHAPLEPMSRTGELGFLAVTLVLATFAALLSTPVGITLLRTMRMPLTPVTLRRRDDQS
ncbi:MAG TPA: oligosaccharide flippase family protein [Ramlibacter sp.]|nr:oligosaccharide flippase family protein [Ramlibacter sp.]